VLGNRTVNTFTIIEGVFNVWSEPKVYRGQQRSFARSQGYEAVMEKSAEYSVVKS
jgi:hypothetical protein